MTIETKLVSKIKTLPSGTKKAYLRFMDATILADHTICPLYPHKDGGLTISFYALVKMTDANMNALTETLLATARGAATGTSEIKKKLDAYDKIEDVALKATYFRKNFFDVYFAAAQKCARTFRYSISDAKDGTAWRSKKYAEAIYGVETNTALTDEDLDGHLVIKIQRSTEDFFKFHKKYAPCFNETNANYEVVRRLQGQKFLVEDEEMISVLDEQTGCPVVYRLSDFSKVRFESGTGFYNKVSTGFKIYPPACISANTGDFTLIEGKENGDLPSIDGVTGEVLEAFR